MENSSCRFQQKKKKMSLGLQPYINQIFLGEFVHLEGELLLVNKQDTLLFSTF